MVLKFLVATHLFLTPPYSTTETSNEPEPGALRAEFLKNAEKPYLKPDTTMEQTALAEYFKTQIRIEFNLKSAQDFATSMQQQSGVRPYMMTTAMLLYNDFLDHSPILLEDFEEEVTVKNLYGRNIQQWKKHDKERFMLGLRACTRTINPPMTAPKKS